MSLALALAHIFGTATKVVRRRTRLRAYLSTRQFASDGNVFDETAVRAVLAAGRTLKVCEGDRIYYPALKNGALTWTNRRTSKVRSTSTVEVSL